ncbi:MAG: septum formation initiator family protein [Prevotella sp.]|nr:septum formation initiator family protein [Prevotella sp.]
MKIVKRFMAAAAKVWHLPFVKYAVISVIGVVLVGFVGQNSLLAHMRNVNYINELSEEIDTYNARAREDMRKIRELDRNPKALERIARERYFMKHDDEDIFVLSDDERSPASETEENERAE